MRLSYQNSRTAAIDKMGWPFAAVIQSYGVRVGLRSNQGELLQEMLTLLPPGATKISEEQSVSRIFSIRFMDEMYHLYTSGRRLITTKTREEIAEWFEAKCRLYIAEHSPEKVFVHAGVVYWKEKLWVIPGRSFSGKTTLTRALIEDGGVYYSDEYAILDEEGLVYPFATPLGMRELGGTAQTKRDAQSLGASVGVSPRRIDRVLAVKYRAGRMKLEEVGAGQGVLLLLANTVSARRAPQRALKVLKSAVQTAKIYKGTRSEAPETLNYLRLLSFQ
jgi:hypothetical protein